MHAQLNSLMLEPYAHAEMDYRRERIMRSYPRRSRVQARQGSQSRLRLRRLRHLPWPRRRTRQHAAIA